MTFGANLKAAREAAGLTPHELAQRVDSSPSTIYRWEQGIGRPSDAKLRSLAEAVGVEFPVLLYGPTRPHAAAVKHTAEQRDAARWRKLMRVIASITVDDGKVQTMMSSKRTVALGFPSHTREAGEHLARYLDALPEEEGTQ